MTFQWLSPGLAWVLLAAAAGASAALFLRRPRPPERLVSSLLVWRQVLDAAPDRSWRERVRWIVSLAITVAIALALALAVSRPVPGAASSDRLLLVFDSSWTMGARTDTGGTRWALAQQAARALAARAGTAEVTVATTAEGVVEGPTADRALVQNVIDRVQPTGGAEGAWPHVAGATAVHFFTDGAVPRLVPSGVAVHSVFVPAPNVAVTAFEITANGDGSRTATLFLAIANYAPMDQDVRVAVGRATEVLADRTIRIASGAVHHEEFTVPIAGRPRFEARIAAAANQLETDDSASAWLWAAAPLRVVVVGDSSTLPALLARDASLQVTAVSPAEAVKASARASADVWVFDGWLPPAPPSRPALLIDPPASAWLGPRGPEEANPIWAPGPGHPLLDGVDPALLQVARARAIVRPSLVPVVLSERGTPLVTFEDARDGRRVVFGFSLAESNIAATPAFPVLMGNALDWLGRPARDLARHPGPVVLPPETVRVVAPDGRTLPIARFDDRATANLDRPGLYLVQGPDGERVLRVTLGDPRRSNLMTSSVAGAPAEPAAPVTSRRPWWMLAGFGAFALGLAEWVTWQRRVTV